MNTTRKEVMPFESAERTTSGLAAIAGAKHPADKNTSCVVSVLALLLLFSCAVAAQGLPVVPWADNTSYATAAINPIWGVVEAWRSSERSCHLAQLGLSEAIGNGLALTLKQSISSPRPCLGCAPDGFPSGHTMNSFIGFSSHWQYGIAFGLSTAALRVHANRHTWTQVAAGTAIGIGADYAGRLVHCQNVP